MSGTTPRRRALRLVVASALRASPRRTVAVFAGSTLAYGMASSLGLWLRLLTDGALRHQWSIAAAGAVGFGVAVSLQVALMGALELLAYDVSERTQIELDEKLLRTMSSLTGIAQHEDPAFADRVTMLLQGGAAAAAGALVRTAGMMVAAAVTLGLLASVHPVLLLLVVASLPPLLFGAMAERSLRSAALARAEHDRREEQLFALLTSAPAMKEIQIAGVAGGVEARRAAAWSRSSGIAATAGTRALLWKGLGTVLFAGLYAAGLAFMLRRALDETASPGDVLLVLVMAFQVSTLMSTAADAVGGAAASLRLAGQQLWIGGYVRSATPARPAAGRVPDRVVRGLSIEQVSFWYPGSSKPAIVELSAHLPAGSVVAIVGENGAGKSTLAKLLCRLYEPTCGVIRVDGADIAGYTAAAWRSGVSGVFQDFARFEMTAQEAVGCGSLQHMGDARAVMAATRRAGADEIVAGLPDGLATQLGRAWPDGVDLSTGQWQRVAAARMAMRPHPLLLMMDEPTGNLDPRTEHEFMERWLAQARSAAAATGTVTVVTSHRLLSVRRADRILVLDRGRLVESGSHDELMEVDGMYRELYELQARVYN
jgi:ATP-binding cassette subfamily B protein